MYYQMNTFINLLNVNGNTFLLNTFECELVQFYKFYKHNKYYLLQYLKIILIFNLKLILDELRAKENGKFFRFLYVSTIYRYYISIHINTLYPDCDRLPYCLFVMVTKEIIDLTTDYPYNLLVILLPNVIEECVFFRRL